MLRASYRHDEDLRGILLVPGILCCQEFEVASVKPADPGDSIVDMVVAPGGRLTITNFTLQLLIRVAYSVEQFQISGGPVWVGQDRYSIVATPPDASQSGEKQELLMLRALLADRFHLKLHRETKEGRVYALVVSSKGPKLQPAKNPDDRPVVGNGFSGNHDSPDVTYYYISGQNVTMPLLAAKLAGFVHQPVSDETGLKGSFDFKFDYAEGGENVFLFEALHKELGLKLESRKGLVEHLVIDHAEKPSAN